MKIIDKDQKEILIVPKLLFFLVKYVLTLPICLLMTLPEAIGRVKFLHYERLPLWEGNLIIVPNHRSWLDVIIVPYIYFPWWFRGFKDDLIDIIKEFLTTTYRFLWWLIDERVKIRIGRGDKIFSRDVPITAADRKNLRFLKWLLLGYIFDVNREKHGGTPNQRMVSARFARRVLGGKGRIIDFAEGGMINSRTLKEKDKLFDPDTGEFIMRKLEPGFCGLVSMTGAKVVPLILKGTDKILPRYKIPLPRFWHKVIIGIGEPLIFPVGTPQDIIEESLDKARISLYHEVYSSH